MFFRVLLGFFLGLVQASAWAQSRNVELFNFSNPKFCVQTFNAYGPLYALNLEFRTDLLLRAMRKQGFCSFSNLQEVWQPGHYDHLRSGLLPNADFFSFHADQLTNSGNNTGLMSVVQGEEIESYVYEYIHNQDGFLDWIREQVGVGKALSITRIKTELSNHPFLLVNTHWHPTSQEIRVAQALEAVQVLLNWQDQKSILFLTGDLNAEPDQLEIRILLDLLSLRDSFVSANKTYNTDDCTYCADNSLSWDGSNRVIDYVLYRSSMTDQLLVDISNVNLKTEYGEFLSDHYGLRTYFALGPQSAKASRSTDFWDKIELARHTLDEAEDFLLSTGQSQYSDLILFIADFRKRLEKANSNDPWIFQFNVVENE